MEITTVLIYACSAGAFFGSGYLWKTAPVSQKLIAPAGAENLPFSVVLVLQLNSLQDELRGCSNEKRREFLKNAIANKAKEINIESKKSANIDFVQGVMGIHEYNQHRLSIGEKPLPLEKKEIDLLRIMGKLPQPEGESILDLQPLNAVVLKKKSILRRLKTAIFEHPKVAQFVFDCAVFWGKVVNFAVLVKFKLSI